MFTQSRLLDGCIAKATATTFPSSSSCAERLAAVLYCEHNLAAVSGLLNYNNSNMFLKMKLLTSVIVITFYENSFLSSQR